ncbi:MAG: insulinase family protein [Opitutales bacterium]|nr:insulinase family protein [Opitutales bacterium]
MKKPALQDPHLEGMLEDLLDEDVERSVLDNGLVLLCKPDSSAPVVSVQCFLRTGSVHEETLPGSGASHYLEHMLFKGTAKREEKEIMEEVQRLGGYSNAYTTYDHTAYHIDLPSAYVRNAVEILDDMVFSSLLRDEDAKSEKEVILREIAMYEDDPYSKMGQVLLETVFREHPYRFPVIGYRDIFAGLTVDELKGYYRERYAPNNAVLVIVGDVPPHECRAMVEEIVGIRPRGRVRTLLSPKEPPQYGARSASLYGEVNLSRQGIAFRIPGMEHEDAAALRILADLLGQGKSSFLWRELREGAELVHDIEAGLWTPSGLGLFTIYFLSEPNQREKALAGVFQAIERFSRNPVAPDKLKKIFRRYCARQIAKRKTMSAQAGALGNAEVVWGDLEYPRAFLRAMSAVTPEDLIRTVKRYFVTENSTEVSLNPEQLRPRQNKRGAAGGKEERFAVETLENGVTLLWQADSRLPTGVVQALWGGGLCYEGAAQAGASSLIARLLAKDTKHHTAQEVEEWTEDHAVQLRGVSGQTFLGLGLEARPHDFDQALTLWQQSLHEPIFREEAFQREKTAAIADFQEEMDDPREYAMYRFRRHYYGEDHPLGHLAGGDDISLQALTPSKIRSLHQELLMGSNLVVAVGGDLPRDKVLSRLREDLTKLPPGKPPRAKSTAGAGTHSRGEVIVEERPAEQEIVILGFPFIGIRDPRARFEVSLLNEIFNGMSSRLFDEVRNRRGLAYYVASSESYGIDEGSYFFYAGTAPGKGPEVLEEMHKEVERIRTTGPTDEEWERCRNFCLSRYAMRRQSINQRLNSACFSALQGYDPNDTFAYQERLFSVPRQAIIDMANEFLQPAHSLGYILKPKG